LDDDGTLKHGVDDFDRICSGFYSKLYSEGPVTTQMEHDRESILSCVSNCITPNMSHHVQKPLTKDELHSALKLMGKGCSLGPDGVTIEFFLKVWELIGDDYTKMLIQSIDQGRLPTGMTSGVITLLFKEGDRANLSNWRPITLLNVSYKVLAKSLQLRLQSIFQEVIIPD